MRETGDGTSGPRRAEPLGAGGAETSDGALGFRGDVSGIGRGALRTGVARLGGVVPATGRADPDPGALPRGGRGPSWAGSAHGGSFGQARGAGGIGGFGFDRVVPHDGYAWWYIDAISEDGYNALTVIAFIGSVFSPYYARARRRGPADPLNHVSINAILYSPRQKYWAMTERGTASVSRSPRHIGIGPSALCVEGGRLTVDIDEWTVPVPRRMRGTITVELGPLFDDEHALDAEGRHTWRPIAPMAHATVRFERPGLDWQGRAYVDMNAGSEPLEAGFRSWTWSREDAGASTRILYDVEQRNGARRGLALDYHPDGSIRHIEPDPPQALPRTGWRVARSTRAAAAMPARVSRTLEDTPFYSRSLLGFDRDGVQRKAIHESVDLDRFAARWVQVLLPFKMPRRTG